MQVTRSAGLKEYDQALRDNADEAQALLGDLLISVTTFFRDGDAFVALAKTVLPELFKARTRKRQSASGSRDAPPARRLIRSP